MAFTGRLASMTREDAFSVVRERGGMPRRGVTRKTSVLIVGEFGWPLLDDGRPSNSLAQAKVYGVPIASERQFLEWLGRVTPEEQTKTYTAEQVSALARAPQQIIEQLGSLGLLAPRGGLYGFRDLAAARQITGLLNAGVALSVITRSLCAIRKWLPDAHLANLRLVAESPDRILLDHMNGQTDKSGQFQLPVLQESEDADALAAAAQHAEDAGETDAAERLYRRLMKLDPADPFAPFRLANLLNSAGRTAEAEAAYRRAIERDAECAEAWYNLAGLLDDQGRVNEATACLRKALEVDPDYTDAIFNLALLLQKLGKYEDALGWWKRYIKRDSTSAWAMRAKRALKYCEMLSASSS